MKPIHTLTVNGETYDLQDDRLDQGFRYLATLANNTGSDVKQLELTQDTEGNPFSCREFYIVGTIPKASAGQLYVGPKMWSWMAFFPNGMSYNYPRTIAIHLSHIADGKWNATLNGADNCATMWGSTGSTCSGTFISGDLGETFSSLCLYGGNSAFPDGTSLEIYGK